MKITREEFKEYVELFRQAWENFKEYEDYINENLLDELMFPLFNWFENKLGLTAYEEMWDMVDIVRGRKIPVDWKVIQVSKDEWDWCDEVYSDDLDVIYDKYLLKENN